MPWNSFWITPPSTPATVDPSDPGDDPVGGQIPGQYVAVGDIVDEPVLTDLGRPDRLEIELGQLTADLLTALFQVAYPFDHVLDTRHTSLLAGDG